MCVIALASWPLLPDRLPTRWSDSEPTRFIGKTLALAILPLFTFALYGVLRVLARRHDANDDYCRAFWWVRVIIPSAVFFGYVAIHLAYWGLGPYWGATFGAMLVGLGCLPPMKRNPWLGVRTPWTLRSDHVWATTNHLGPRLLVIYRDRRNCRGYQRPSLCHRCCVCIRLTRRAGAERVLVHRVATGNELLEGRLPHTAFADLGGDAVRAEGGAGL